MNEAAHFARFKKARKQRMLVAHKIDQSPLTAQNGHDGKRKLHDSLHLPAQLPWPMRAREWFRHTFGQGWEYVVVNKSVDSVTMPKWIASSILGTVLLFGVSSWWRASDQRDMLIELRTELKMAKEFEAERSKELKIQADMNKVYIDNMTNQLNIIKGMLSQQQLNEIDARSRKEN